LSQHLPPIRQIQYLLALREELHFGRAAEKLFVTQSTLSTGIKELETFLGVTLVERTNKSVAFTQIGEDVVARGRRIIVHYEEMITHAHNYQDPLSMPIKLGVIPTIAPYLVANYVSSIKQSLPDIKLYIRENTTNNLISELQDGKLDLLILAFPYDVGNLQTQMVFREKLLLGHRKKTKLLTKKQLTSARLDFNSLPDESLLLLDDGHCLREHALAGCRLRNQNKIHTFGANSLQMLIQMVDNDLGMTLIPEMAVSTGILRPTQIETRELSDTFFRDIGFVWRKGNYRETELMDLMGLLSAPTAA